MPTPNTGEQDYFRRTEPLSSSTAKADPRELNYFRRGEPYSGSFLSPAVATVTTDVTSDADMSMIHTSDVISSADISSTATANVTTTADITTTHTSDVTSNADIIVPGMVTTDVTSTADITTTHTSDVTSSADIAETVTLSVSTTADISTARTTDVTTTADIITPTTVSTDVTTTADISETPTLSIATDADISIPIRAGAGLLYFVAGSSDLYGAQTPYELWKYDGINPPSFVWSIPTTNGSWISALKYSTFMQKLYINVHDEDHLSGTGHTQATIYELDPVDDSVTLIISYSYTDTLDEFSHAGNQPALIAYEDVSGAIYWLHQAYNYREHIVKFIPASGVVSLVTNVYQYNNVGGNGWMAKVGTYYYWADGDVIRRTTTPDVAVSWTDYFTGVASNLADLLVGDVFLGADFYFAAVNEWGTDGRGHTYLLALEIFKLDTAGTITKVFQDDEQGLTHPPDNYYLQGWQPAQVVNVGGKLLVYNDGIDNFQKWNGSAFVRLQSSGMAITSVDGTTWVWEEIPYSVYLVQNQQASYGQGSILFGNSLYLIQQYLDSYDLALGGGTQTTGQGHGVQLLKRDVSGVWTSEHRWANYNLWVPSHGPDTQIEYVQTFPHYDVITDAIIFAVPPPIIPVVCEIPARSWVVLYDTNGIAQAVFDDWKTLDLVHKLNSYSTLTFAIDLDDPRIELFTLDSIIEVWREIGSYQYIEYTGFHRVGQQQLTPDQHSIFTSMSRGLLDLVRRRTLFYKGIIAQTLKQDHGSTVIWQIVNENVGPGAADPLRFVNGVTPNFTLAVDPAMGPIYTAQLANDNILDTITNIATQTGVDFDVIRTSSSPPAFEFRTYWPQRGTDRHTYLAFAHDLGNMIGEIYNVGYDVEINVAAALGTGTDAARHVAVFTGADLGASPWNRIEGTVDASSQDTYEAMQTAAETSLKNTAAKETFTFDVVQSDAIRYGRDYFVGDIVSARFNNIMRNKKIVAATISIAAGIETIKLDFADLP
jgi:hypothetical protein